MDSVYQCNTNTQTHTATQLATIKNVYNTGESNKLYFCAPNILAYKESTYFLAIVNSRAYRISVPSSTRDHFGFFFHFLCFVEKLWHRPHGSHASRTQNFHWKLWCAGEHLIRYYTTFKFFVCTAMIHTFSIYPGKCIRNPPHNRFGLLDLEPCLRMPVSWWWCWLQDRPVALGTEHNRT